VLFHPIWCCCARTFDFICCRVKARVGFDSLPARLVWPRSSLPFFRAQGRANSFFFCHRQVSVFQPRVAGGLTFCFCVKRPGVCVSWVFSSCRRFLSPRSPNPAERQSLDGFPVHTPDSGSISCSWSSYQTSESCCSPARVLQRFH
jgi:hypothetical protein